MKFKILFTISFSVLFALAGNSQNFNEEKILKSFHSISSHDLLNIAEELSSEKYKGRLSGSPEYLEAAKWCANQFESWGVKPANNGSWFQYFDNAYSEVYTKGKVSYLAQNGEVTELQFPDETMPGFNSASGAITEESEKVAEQIFTGSGKDYKQVKKQLADFQIPSFLLNPQQKVTIEAKTKHFPDSKSCNVVGLIEGSDPILKNEVIIVGGHLDGQGHLGELFPSALDNASGIADVMGAAKPLAQ